ncbi:MAG: hypothetical protein KAJ03_07450 [Gammaproteobacteria bacterium]|nr:hypothetical protein [Gammaproteobacteria bacterium]
MNNSKEIEGLATEITVFWIKFLHTLIFVVLCVSVLYALYSGITNRLNFWTAVALGLIAVEGIVLILNGWRCPLTRWAERVGAKNGSVSDIFLPAWLANHLFSVCTPICVVAYLMILIRIMTN